MENGTTTATKAQREFDAADAATRAALVNYAHGRAFVEDQDRLEGIPERAARINAEIDAEAAHVHAFERAGLGLAPFRFVGLEHRTYKASPDAPTQPGGSCDFCGTGISFFCWIKSADGKTFKVGQDCVRRVDDKPLSAEILAARKAERAAIRAELRAKAAAERDEERTRKAREASASFLAKHEGLEAAFLTGASASHTILADLHAKLVKWGSLSDKQVAFALRLADEVRKPRPAEVHVPAPTGRVTVEGEVVSLREVRNPYGYGSNASTLKMVVRVDTPAGSWLCWSTVPLSLGGSGLRGKRVRFDATLEPGKDAHFAFAKRPTKAEVLEDEAVPA